MTQVALSQIGPEFQPDALDDRIIVHESAMVVELRYTGLSFHTSAQVNAFFDRVEDRISDTGEPLWFFLADVTGYRIDEPAWLASSRRGTALRQAHSMGNVRFDTGPGVAADIAAAVGTDRQDPGYFATRDAAFAALRALPVRRNRRVDHVPSFDRDSFDRRISFDPVAGIMEIDFTGVSFEHSRDVNDVYNWIESRARPLARKWYFLINYDGTRIQDSAWVQYAARGKALNEAFSLGSVRYAPGSETETDIRLRAESQGFRPNIRNTRAEALERIAEMKAEIARLT